MTPEIWHNPRCTKSRLTLELLQAEGFDPHIVKYLETAPSLDQIRQALKKLGISARELIRDGEPIYKELGLSAESSEDELIAAMHQNPILIERPVVIVEDRAAIGRPPELVLPILPK